MRGHRRAILALLPCVFAAQALLAHSVEVRMPEKTVDDAQSLAEQTAREEAARELQRANRAAGALAAPANLGLGVLPTTRFAVAGQEPPKGLVGEFLLEGSSKDKAGTVSIGWKNGHDQFQLKATGPLDRSNEFVPLSLEGIASDATFALSFSRFEFGSSTRSEIVEYHDELCPDAQAAYCKRNPADCDLDSTKWMQDACAQRVPCPGSPGGNCTAAICEKDVCDYRNLRGRERSRARELLHLDDPIWFWGASVTGGRTGFEYLDESTLAAHSLEKTSWAVNARVGLLAGSFGFLIGSYDAVRQWRAGGAEKTICRPLDGTDATTCADAVIGAPVERKRSVVKGEIRKFLANGAALAPSIQRDLTNKVTLVALPVYFIKNKEGGAVGGVRLAWRSDTDATTVSVFVGAALTLD